MLTDIALRNLKPKARPYKVSDRDGMYVTVSPAGTVTFRYDYRLNGRRETLTIGRFVLPSRYDVHRSMSHAMLNRVTVLVVQRVQANVLPLEPFTVHDLRRTGSTLLNEVGFNRDWIKKCLAHEEGRSSPSIYNKAGYAEQRRHMLQEW